MRFIRHEESIDPMWFKTWWGHRLLTPKPPLAAIPSAAKTTACRRLRGIGPDQVTRTCQEAHAPGAGRSFALRGRRPSF
jgi:hypothetical protein